MQSLTRAPMHPSSPTRAPRPCYGLSRSSVARQRAWAPSSRAGSPTSRRMPPLLASGSRSLRRNGLPPPPFKGDAGALSFPRVARRPRHPFDGGTRRTMWPPPYPIAPRRPASQGRDALGTGASSRTSPVPWLFTTAGREGHGHGGDAFVQCTGSRSHGPPNPSASARSRARSSRARC